MASGRILPDFSVNPSVFTVREYRAYLFKGAQLAQIIPFPHCTDDKVAKARAVGIFLTAAREVARLEVWRDSDRIFVINKPRRPHA